MRAIILLAPLVVRHAIVYLKTQVHHSSHLDIDHRNPMRPLVAHVTASPKPGDSPISAPHAASFRPSPAIGSLTSPRPCRRMAPLSADPTRLTTPDSARGHLAVAMRSDTTRRAPPCPARVQIALARRGNHAPHATFKVGATANRDIEPPPPTWQMEQADGFKFSSSFKDLFLLILPINRPPKSHKYAQSHGCQHPVTPCLHTDHPSLQGGRFPTRLPPFPT